MPTVTAIGSGFTALLRVRSQASNSPIPRAIVMFPSARPGAALHNLVAPTHPGGIGYAADATHSAAGARRERQPHQARPRTPHAAMSAYGRQSAPRPAI